MERQEIRFGINYLRDVAPLEFAISRVRKFSRAYNYQRDIISHLSHLNAPRENAETKSPLSESAHQRVPTRRDPANYGEIAAKFAM